LHAKAHEALIAQVRKIQVFFNDNDKAMTESELTTLQNWLIEHIRTQDSAFVLYLNKTKNNE
jgi:hemerythrin